MNIKFFKKKMSGVYKKSIIFLSAYKFLKKGYFDYYFIDMNAISYFKQTNFIQRKLTK